MHLRVYMCVGSLQYNLVTPEPHGSKYICIILNFDITLMKKL
jgi:hypothetical protein